MAYRPISGASTSGDFAPIGLDRQPVVKFVAESAVEFGSRRVQMATGVQRVAGIGSVKDDIIPKGTFYPEDTSADSSVLLEATKFGQAVPLADEDLADLSSFYAAQDNLGSAWATSHAVKLDNAALGVTAAGTGAGTSIPFTSVYRVAKNGGGNYASFSLGTGLTENNILDFLSVYEEGDAFGDSDTLIIAHPRFKSLLGKMVDSNGDKLFGRTGSDIYGTGEFSSTRRGSASLYTYPVLWSRGAITSATATHTQAVVTTGTAGTAGHPLLIAVNRQNLLLGVPRGVAGPESKMERIPGKDVVEMMFRARRAFALGSPASASVLEMVA